MKTYLNDTTLKSIHSLAIAAAKDDVAPVITQIALMREGDHLRAAATDRYMVASGLYRNVTFDDWEEGETVLVDPKALKTVIDIRKTMPVEIERVRDTDQVKAIIDTITVIDIGRASGAFPPVMKLFPRDKEANGAGRVALRPDFLAKLAKIIPAEARPGRDRVWSFEFRSSLESNKPEPVYARYSASEDYELEALIQPNIIR
jgi:DNA polymerase III sliding clamp (beta) subunit (PCNA family)